MGTICALCAQGRGRSRRPFREDCAPLRTHAGVDGPTEKVEDAPVAPTKARGERAPLPVTRQTRSMTQGVSSVASVAAAATFAGDGGSHLGVGAVRESRHVLHTNQTMSTPSTAS